MGLNGCKKIESGGMLVEFMSVFGWSVGCLLALNP